MNPGIVLSVFTGKFGKRAVGTMARESNGRDLSELRDEQGKRSGRPPPGTIWCLTTAPRVSGTERSVPFRPILLLRGGEGLGHKRVERLLHLRSISSTSATNEESPNGRSEYVHRFNRCSSTRGCGSAVRRRHPSAPPRSVQKSASSIASHGASLRWLAELDQGYRSGRETMPARTGFHSTYRRAISRCRGDSTQLWKRACHRCPRLHYVR